MSKGDGRRVRMAAAARVGRAAPGWVSISGGEPEDPVEIVVDDPGALETARALVATVEGRPDLRLGGEVASMSIRAPDGQIPGRLTLNVSSGGKQEAVTLLIDWPSLVQLARVAGQALDAARPPGSA
ncbi:MAG: hypothetical protein KF842_06925 [Caulobacter sp.]|nr:hypothetical protein [Caulobacter sp.]